jgi:hypothetical protein
MIGNGLSGEAFFPHHFSAIADPKLACYFGSPQK